MMLVKLIVHTGFSCVYPNHLKIRAKHLYKTFIKMKERCSQGKKRKPSLYTMNRPAKQNVNIYIKEVYNYNNERSANDVFGFLNQP